MYPGADPIAYARAIGCEGIALQSIRPDHRALALAASEAFGADRVWWYDGPASWTPGQWRQTLDRCLALAGPGGNGVIADVETASQWAAAPTELAALGDALAQAATDLRPAIVVVTSPPAHAMGRSLGAASGLIYGSPQLYGRSAPLTSYRKWRSIWASAFEAGVRPSIALPDGGWPSDAMTVSAYREYLQALRDSGAAAWVFVWHASATRPTSPYVAALADYARGRDLGVGGRRRGLLAAVILACAAAASGALYYAAQ